MNLCCNQWSEPNYRHKSLSDAWQSKVSGCGLELLNIGDTYFANHPDKNGRYAQSALDHIYVSDKELAIKYGKLRNSSTDHYPVFINVKNQPVRTKFKTTTIIKRSFKKFSVAKFSHDLARQPWEELATAKSIDDMVKIYEKLMLN